MDLDPLRQRFTQLLERSVRTAETTRGGRFGLDILRAIVAVAHGFRGEKISLRASALTYISIFSLVPTLAVGLAFVEALGRHELHDALRAFTFDVLAPGIREETSRLLDHFIHSASSATAGGVGFIVLAITAGSLLKNLDSSINEIWVVRRKRPLTIRISIYAGILILGPILLAISLAGMGLVREAVTQYVPFSEAVLTLLGAIVAVAGFTFLYMVAPNANVRFRSALAGGLVGGLGWDIAKHVYGQIASQTFRASPVWGSLGAVPLFLTWIYVSWLLLLFGARLSYAVQFAWFRRGMPDLVAYPRTDALIAARVASILTRVQLAGSGSILLKSLASELRLTIDTLEPVIEQLVRGGILRLQPGGYVEPARPLEELTLADIALAVGGADTVANPASSEGKGPLGGLEAVLQKAEDEFLERLRRIRWRDLPRLEASPSAVPEPASEPADQSASEKP